MSARATPLLLTVLLCLLASAWVLAQSPRPAAVAPSDFVAPGPVVPLGPPLAGIVERVQGSALRAHVRFLASSSLEGRGLGSKGLEATAEYVAAMLALSGILPASGPSRASYFQEVPLRRIDGVRATLTIERGRGATASTKTFAAGRHARFPEIAPQVLRGAVVFAGYGMREPGMGRDDYRGLDPRGKIVVVLSGTPPGAEWRKPELADRYEHHDAKLEAAAALGALALVAVEGDAALSEKRPAPSASYFTAADADETVIPLVRVDGLVARALLGAAVDRRGVAKPRPVPGATATIRISGRVRPLVARNVIGLLPGSDPALRDEAIVLGAHMDHLGNPGGRIHPGADDNGSGVAAVLEIARAVAASPARPKRSLLFAFWTGEEEGHFGSEHYVRHPVWPIERTRVYANLDMIGHPWLRSEIEKLVREARLPDGARFLSGFDPSDFVEPGVAQWAPELCSVLGRAARGLGLAMHCDRTDGKSGGSDYRAFARAGVPFIRFFGNYFPGYHEPSDTVESLDVDQAARVARLSLAAAWLLAEQ